MKIEKIDIESAPRINLGCGRDYKNFFYNLDSDTDVRADIYWNLNEYPYPFEDNSALIIHAENVMEHLDKPQKFIEECYRVLRPGGKILIQVPIYGTWAAAHINHPYAGFSPYSFKILEQERWAWEFKCRYKITKMKVTTPFSWKIKMNWRFAFMNMFINNLFSQMFVEMEAIK